MQVLASTAAQRIIGPVHGVRDWSRQRGIIPDIRITHSLSFVPSRTPLRNVRTCQACWTGDEEKEGMGLHKRLLLGRKRNCKVQYVPTHDIFKKSRYQRTDNYRSFWEVGSCRLFYPFGRGLAVLRVCVCLKQGGGWRGRCEWREMKKVHSRKGASRIRPRKVQP